MSGEPSSWQAPALMCAANIASFYPESTEHVSDVGRRLDRGQGGR